MTRGNVFWLVCVRACKHTYVFAVTLQLSTGEDSIAIESALLMKGVQGLVFLSITLH